MKRRAVWKFPLKPSWNETKEIELPRGAQVLSVGHQPQGGDEFFLWALVDPDEEEKDRKLILLATTGFVMEASWGAAPDWVFVGTILSAPGENFPAGDFILHVWISDQNLSEITEATT